MSFNIGPSGLYAASRKLYVTGNHIANAANTGFKFSRVENADVYSATKLGSGSNGHFFRERDVRHSFASASTNCMPYTQSPENL